MFGMKREHLEPARSIIAKIGVEKMSEITGKHVSRVYRWMHPKEKGGTGGLIPQSDQPAILKYARDARIKLSERDFFPPITAERFDSMCETQGIRVTGSSPKQETAA